MNILTGELKTERCLLQLEQLAITAEYQEARVVVGLKNWQALRFWLNLGFNQITKIVGDEVYSDTTYADVELLKDI
mgnify:FL=1